MSPSITFHDLLDPFTGARTSVRLEGGKMADRAEHLAGETGTNLDASDLWFLPGLYDADAHLPVESLGLRAGEIVCLKLDDIDWESGTLTIHGKARRDSTLPLLADVGAAIAAYLKDGRPRSGSRRVFLCAQAPVRSFKAGNAVSTVVKYALERTGIESPRKGAHQFRHALATEMLRRKSSLSEIGEVLGHRNPDTTKIYTKVDLHSLRELAPPWPRS